MPGPDKKETGLVFVAAPATPGEGSVKLSVASNSSIHSKLKSNSLDVSVISTMSGTFLESLIKETRLYFCNDKLLR